MTEDISNQELGTRVCMKVVMITVGSEKLTFSWQKHNIPKPQHLYTHSDFFWC